MSATIRPTANKTAAATLVLLILATVLPLLSPAAQAAAAPQVCTTTWDGEAGTTDWHHAANWTTDVLPGPADVVCVHASTTGNAGVVLSAGIPTEVAALQSDTRIRMTGGALHLLGDSYTMVTELAGGVLTIDTKLVTEEMTHDSGLVDGDGLLRVVGYYRWEGGEQWGPGRTEIVTSTGTPDGIGGLLMEGNTNRRALGRPIDAVAGMEIDAGSLEFAGPDSVLTLGSPSGVVAGAGWIKGSGRVQVNSELIVAGGGSLDIEARMDSGDDAAIQVRGESVLSLYGGGTHGGSFFMEDAASLQLRGGTTTFKENTPVTAHGEGEVQVASEDSDVTVLGTYGVGETTILAGTLRLNEGADTGPVDLLGGTLDVTGEVVAEQVGQDQGTLTGTGTLTVTGDYEWVRGVQSGEGTTDIEGTLYLTGVDVNRTIDTRSVDAVLLDWTENNTITFTGDEPALGAQTTSIEGIDAKIEGPAGTFLPGDLQLLDGTLVVKSAFETKAEDEGRIEGGNAFLDLQGGGVHLGSLDSDGDPIGLNLGGVHTFAEGSDIRMSDVPIGIYDTGDVTFGGQTVAEEINNSGSVTVDNLVNIGPFINHGVLTINDGKTVWASRFAQPSEEGWTDLAGPEAELLLADGGDAVITAGIFEGSGKVTGDVVNEGGTMSPVGELDITGNYTQESIAELAVETDGNSVDRLTVGGAATLDGTLDVTLGEETSTQPLEVLKASIVSGQFTMVAGSNECWNLVTDATGVYLWPRPCMTIEPASGAEDFGVVTFPVTLSEPYDADVTLSYATQNGTATAGSDFEAASGTLTLVPGQTETEVAIALTGDEDVEPDETFSIAVSASGAELGVTTVTGTIRNDDEEEEEQAPGYTTRQPNLQGMFHYPEESNDKYVVGHSNFDNFGTDFAFYNNVETNASAYWGDVIYANDINATNQLVGYCGEPQWIEACFRSNLTNHDVVAPAGQSPSVQGLNDQAQLVGSLSEQAGPSDWVTRAALWAGYDQAPYVLLDDATAIDINNNGIVVGTSYGDAGASSAWIWSTNNAFVDIPEVPGHPRMVPEAINSRGTVVGYATDGAGSIRAWSWHPSTGTVDLGPGFARDINKHGDIVGSIADRATLWRDGEAHDLNEMIPADIWVLGSAETINDKGMIATRAWDFTGQYVAVLHPEGEEPVPAEVSLEVTTDEPEYPTGAWTPTNGQVIDGNAVRLTATVTNDDDVEHTVDVEILDPDDQPLHDEDITLTLAAGESQDVEVEWDSTGRAWNGADPRDTQWLTTTVFEGIMPLKQVQAGIEVDPRPAVLVHGLWSDESTWDAYPQMLAEAHPGWRGYAIDTMDTQSFVPNLISENANLLDTYVRQVQEGENAWQVDLVGHSMGGLISRFYIQEFMTTLEGKNAVAHLVMLGTPNGGSPCAELAAVPATYELRPDVQAEFNAAITDRKGVPFSLAAGINTPFTCHAPLPGDDVVPVESAQLGVEDTLLFEIGHTSMTGSEMLFDQWVLPHLATDAAGIDGAALAPEASESAATGGGAADPAPEEQLLFARSIHLGAGEAVTELVDLEDGIAAIGAMAVAPGSVEVTLAPSTATDKLATSGTVEDENPGFRTVNVSDPAAGEWMITVINHGDAEVEVPLSAWMLGSDATFEVEATQVGTTGSIQVTARLDAGPFSEGPWIDAEVMDLAGRVEGVQLHDDGEHGDGAADDLVFGGEADGFTSGGHLVVVEAEAPFFSRAAITTVDLAVEGDTPGNDAPTATALDHTANRNTTSWITLEGEDPDADDLTFEVLTQPGHGTLTVQGPAGSPLVKYVPQGAYMGADSFTFRAFDGELWSEPATVSIDVIGMETTFTYFSPWPAQGVEGTDLLVTANLVDSRGEGPQWAPVEFTFNGATIPSQTGIGLASASLDLRGVAPGQYELGFSFAGNATHLPSSGSKIITVVASTPPNPFFAEPIVGEAGYPVSLGLRANDPDANAELYELDFTDDGTYDVAVTHVSTWNEPVWVEHTYPAAFEGTVRARVTDNTGLATETTTTVDIAPHRPLGDLRMIEVDDVRVKNIDLSADGDTILYGVTDNEDQFQLPTPYGVLDRETGEHEIVSILPDGSQADWPGSGAISAGGDFVVFSGPEAPGAFRAQAYLRDVEAGTTTMISRNTAGQPASNGAFPVDVSADGRYVLFSSSAPNLTSQNIMQCGTHGSQPCDQLYLRDTVDGTTTLISTGPDGVARGGHYWADLTDDGRFVAFDSGDELLLWDRDAEATELLDVTTDGEAPDSETSLPRLSEDGRYLTFTSGASNIADGAANDDLDVFRHDRQTGATTIVGVTPEGVAADRGSSFSMSNCDGSLIVFWSYATDLVDGDTNEHTDVFLRDMNTGITRRISVEDRDQIEGDWDSQLLPRISADGRWVTFESEASNLVPGDTNGAARDTFLFDTGITRGCNGETNDPPVVDIGPAGGLVEGGALDLAATFSDPDGDELTATWTTDAGTIEGDSGTSATLAVDDGPEDVHVTLTVSDGTVSSSDTVTVVVTNAPPTAAAGADLEVVEGTEVTFVGAATDPSTADTEAGIVLTWDVGDTTADDLSDTTDGSSDQGGDATHTYDEPGTYTATLTATDKDGGQDTDTRTITVTEDEPVSTVPGPPVDVSAIGGDGEADVQWDPPLSDGGSPVLGYELVVSPGGATHELGNVETYLVPGLTNGTEYTFSVRARNANGYGPFSAASNVAVPRALCAEDAFTDVTDDHPFCPEIDWMADHDIAEGWPDGTYRPLRHVSRAAMAAFSYRLAGSERGADPECEEQPFPDVAIDNPFCGEITWARDNGISTGYGDGTFRSAESISRQGMAAFLYRLTGSPRGEDPGCTQDEFTDVPAAHGMCGEIDWMVDSGLAAGYDDGSFKPNAPISRQAMAALIFRYDVLTGIVTG